MHETLAPLASVMRWLTPALILLALVLTSGPVKSSQPRQRK